MLCKESLRLESVVAKLFIGKVVKPFMKKYGEARLVFLLSFLKWVRRKAYL